MFGTLPPIAGGTMGVGISLPSRACWVFVYLDAAATSTVVDDLTIAGPAGFVLPSGGISESQAIQIATQHTGAVAIDAISGPLSSLGLQSPPLFVAPDRAVWGVEFPDHGLICSPAPGATCVPYSGTAIVVLDYETGAFLFSTLESYTTTSPSP